MTTIAETLASLERLANAAEFAATKLAAGPLVMRLRLDIENVRRLADKMRKQAERLEEVQA